MRTISIPEKEKAEEIFIEEGGHSVGEFIGDAGGATLLVIGSIHGNEPSALIAMRRMLPALEKLRNRIRGRIYLLAGNTRALRKNVRFIDRDLNRHWTLENIIKNDPSKKIPNECAEDLEQSELLEILEEIFSTARSEIYALDLHSTSSKSTPFAMIGDTLRNREFAEKFPATFLLGIEEQLDGTVLEYISNRGAVTLGFEAGQHTDKIAAVNQEALIWLALLNAGILTEVDRDFERDREILREAMGARRRIIEIRRRHRIEPGDEFRMKPGYENFQAVRRGEILAADRVGEIPAPESGLILMPLYQAQGDDGFFLGREIAPFWLKLSSILRRLKIPELVRFLPGVERHPSDPEKMIVDTRTARFFPLRIFHLLGFRKVRRAEEKLIVARRRFDSKSPFGKKQN